jgi:integrase
MTVLPVPDVPARDSRRTGADGVTFTSGHHFTLEASADLAMLSETAVTPLSVIVQVTKRCDFNCGFCSETLQMPDPTLAQLDAVRANLAGVQRVFLSGGEPLLRRDLPDIVDMYSGFILGLPTNAKRGLVQAPHLAGKVAFVNIGFDGPRARFSRVRGDYDKVMTGVRAFQEAGLPISLSAVVMRNVAELVSTPKGTEGRPSKAMTFDQATAMLEQAKKSRMHAYMVVSLLTGIRTEEARALQWTHVVAWLAEEKEWQPVTEAGFDHDRFAIYVWRSVRATGDTKTPKSRRTLELPTQAATALKNHRTDQLKERLAAGPLWHEHGLVFTTQSGEPLDAANVRRSLRRITKRAKLGEDWTPRELRHSFVSIMSDHGVSIETIADLVGHASTAVTETVYRHQLKPVITRGAETMNTIFAEHAEPKSA